MRLRDFFWTGLVIWWGGALIGRLTGIGILHGISVNIFGLLTIALGLFLLGRWIWRKMSGGASANPSRGDPSAPRTGLKIGQGMGIYSTFNVPEEARETIERAIQNDNFKPKGKTVEGWELLYIQTPTQDWLAVVEVTDAITINAAYKTSAHTVEREVNGLLSA